MAGYTIEVDLHTMLSPPQHCPDCGSELEAVALGERTRFRCAACRRDWQVRLGRMCCPEPVAEVEAGSGKDDGQCGSD